MHDLYTTVFEIIDMRSFSNLWYWLGLAAVWSTRSHWVLGVPFDMVARAQRYGGQSETDLEDMVRINVNRLLFIADVSGLWLIAIGCMALSVLAVLGFWYTVEFAQALFLILFPLSIVGLLSIFTARAIAAHGMHGETLRRRIVAHRRVTQVIGMISIFVTAMWGMYVNLDVGPYGI